MKKNEIKVYRSKDGKKEVHLNIWAAKLFEICITEFSIEKNLVPEFRLTPDIFGVESFLPELKENDLAVKLLSEFDIELEVAKSLIADRICSIPDDCQQDVDILKEKWFGLDNFYKIQDWREHGDIIDTYKETREILKKTY